MANCRINCVLLAFVFLANSSAIGHAANIQASDDKLCAFKLSGEIIAGDDDHLATLISQSHLDEYDQRTTTLCLASPGGSFYEGLKIAETIYAKGISTLIADGSKCFSACAIIFMAGVTGKASLPTKKFLGGSSRKLSAKGVLGFHAPFFSVPEGRYSKEDLEVVADGMRMGLLGLIRLSSKPTSAAGNDFIKKSLLVEMLEKGPQEAFVVRTIAEAARLDIYIYDSREQFPKPDNVSAIKNLCMNFHYANMDEPVPTNPPELSLKADKYVSKWNKNDFRILVRDARTEDTICEVYPRTDKGHPNDIDFFACSYDYWTNKNFGDCRAYKTAISLLIGNYVPDFFTLAPQTVLPGTVLK